MSSEVERLVLARQHWLRVDLVGLVLWLGATILRDALGLTGSMGGRLMLVSLIGCGVWGVSMWQITNLTRRVSSDRRVMGALEDELTQANRFRAAAIALGVLLAVQSVSIPVFTFAPHALSPLVIAEANLLIGLTALIGAFLYLEQKGAEA
jgi:hypothetical protein